MVKDPNDQLSDEGRYCGNKQEQKRDKCPAYGKTCSSCGKANHLCSKNWREPKKKRSQKFKHKKVNQLDDITEYSNSLKKKRSCQCLFTTPPTLRLRRPTWSSPRTLKWISKCCTFYMQSGFLYKKIICTRETRVVSMNIRWMYEEFTNIFRCRMSRNIMHYGWDRFKVEHINR